MALALSLAAACARDARPEYRIRWAFWAVTADAKRAPVGDFAVLPSGTELGMRLELAEPAYACVVHQGPRGDVNILLARGEATTRDAQREFEPLGSGQRLDDATGLERFHLIVSPKPLGDLDRLIDAYRSAPPDRKTGAAEALLAEVQRLRRDHEKLEAVATKPAQIGGTVRGQDDVGAVELSGTGILVRTFTVDHR
jgi:hypothetical protein